MKISELIKVLEQLKSKNGDVDVCFSSNSQPVDFEYSKYSKEIHLKTFGYPITKQTGKDTYGTRIEKTVGEICFFDEDYPHIEKETNLARISPAEVIILDDKSEFLLSYELEN